MAAIGLLGTFLQAMLVVLLVLLALSNLGIDVGALIAGLGIGGIAIALPRRCAWRFAGLAVHSVG